MLSSKHFNLTEKQRNWCILNFQELISRKIYTKESSSKAKEGELAKLSKTCQN